MTNLLQTPEFSTACFEYDPTVRRFFAEASTLMGHKFNVGQVYADACDVGFTLVSKRTQRYVKLVEVREIRSEEGELQATHFAPVVQADRKLFDCVVIFND